MSELHEQLARASAWLWPALANHLWQATLFAALVFGLTLLLRRGAPARLRYALWLIASLKFAAPAALFAYAAASLGLDSLWRSTPAAGQSAPLLLTIAEPVVSAAPDLVVGVSAARGHEELFCALTLVWLAGCAALVFVWLAKRREFVRSVRAGEEAWAGREYEALGRARARLGLAREVLLVLSQGRTEPGVWRTRRPVLLLPSEVASELDDEELEAVVLHELAHVERRDNLCGNFQTVLSCVFWFNPVVWLVGRKLFAERESACDERVLEAGGASGAYAAGILKVVRFCSGWRVAGVAGVASGSNLRRRIEMIMLGEKGGGARAWHRAILSGLGAAALALTVGAGLFGRGTTTTSARMLEGAGGAPQESVRGGGVVVAGGGQRGAESREQEAAVREVLEQSQEAGVNFEQAPDAPVQITEARMRMLTREQLRRANGQGADTSGGEGGAYFLTLPTVTVANTSAKTVHEIGIGFETDGRVSVVAGYAAGLRPGESKAFRSEWRRRNVLFPGTFGDVKVRVVWVEFEDGTTWGTRMRARVPAPPHAPDAPDAPGVPEPPARGSGSADVTVTSSGGGVVRVGSDTRVSSGSGSGTGVGSGTARGGGDGVGSGSGAGSGSGVGIGVDVVRASAGGGRGAGQGGNGTYTPMPSYPEIAKAAGAEGNVSVRVTVNEEGNVIAAEAVSGHPLLRTAAVDAARQSKFKPTVVDGKPVKVSAVISYVFSLK